MLDTMWGHDQDLDAIQMATRAFVLFFVALVLVRIGGMRVFGRKSSFDTIVAVLLGAILSRAVFGASDTLSIMAACTTLVLVHRWIAYVTARWPAMEHLVKGKQVVVYTNGAAQVDAMRRHGVSQGDLLRSRAARSTAPTSPRSRRSAWRRAAS